MSNPLEIFRFVTTRRIERLQRHRINSRLIRDLRTGEEMAIRDLLFGSGEFSDKLRAANDGYESPRFIHPSDPDIAALDRAVDYFRSALIPGKPLDEIVAELQAVYPLAKDLLGQSPAEQVLQFTQTVGRIWDSLYTQVIRGCARYLTTNYLADALRVVQVLRLLLLNKIFKKKIWNGFRFDEYEVLITLPTPVPGDPRRDEPSKREQPGTTTFTIDDPFGSKFRVPLSVGPLRPPMVGDLIRVEQELRRYELGELAKIENVLKGEKREFSTRDLSRVSTTTTTESESETTETESRTIDERFSLANEAQKTANESFAASLGVNVSGKFGPVQVGVSANASYAQSKSSSESASQEFARQVTDEASKTVRNSVKQSSSTTILTESEQTSLHGFDNVAGAGHISGLYRWVDKVYAARTVNYGRRLMLILDVPEAAAYFRGLIGITAEAQMEALEEPLPPSRYSFHDGDLEIGGSERIDSHTKITIDNYAALAAVYGVSDIAPPPPERITGSKAISYPLTSQAGEVNEHTAEGNELSYVAADNSLTVDPNYQLNEIGVWAPEGSTGGFRNYAKTLKLGANSNDKNTILILVGQKSFHFVAEGVGNDKTEYDTNFNQIVEVTDSEQFWGVVQPSLPITIQADFEGLLTFTVIYTASLRPQALEQWQIATYGAIVQGYQNLKQDYDQKRAALQAKTDGERETKVYQLRDEEYRTIEQTELKRCSIELISRASAAGYGSIRVGQNGVVEIAFDPPSSSSAEWRSPIANGAVAEFFEFCLEWDQMTYQFLPYYWTDRDRWAEMMDVSSDDPGFEAFLKSGMAQVIVPVRPGHERAVILYLKSALLWCGAYLPLFDSDDFLGVFADVENGAQLDPPLQIGESWDIVLPTTMIKLQPDDVLPEFPVSFDTAVTSPPPSSELPGSEELPF